MGTKEEINKKEQEGTSTTTDIPSQPKEEQLLAAQKEIEMEMEKVKAASAPKTADAPLKTKSPPGKGKAARLALGDTAGSKAATGNTDFAWVDESDTSDDDDDDSASSESSDSAAGEDFGDLMEMERKDLNLKK